MSRLASHWQQAGDGPRAIRYARMAAREANTQLGYEEAARLYRLALGLAAAGGLDAAGRCEVLLDLATAEYRCGNVRPAMEAFVQAADLARRCGRPGLLAGAPLIVQDIGDLEVNASVLRACEGVLAGAGGLDAAVRARLLAQRAVALCESGRLDEALPDSERAMELAGRSGDPGLAGRGASGQAPGAGRAGLAPGTARPGRPGARAGPLGGRADPGAVGPGLANRRVLGAG